MRHATWAIAALLLTGVLALAASLALDSDRASPAPTPTGSTGAALPLQGAAPAPAPAEPLSTAGAAAPPPVPAAPAEALVSIPPAANATPAAAGDATGTECDRRMTENESALTTAVQDGKGASFHCVTRCVGPTSLRIPPSRAEDLPGLDREVDAFVEGAAALGDAAGEVCRTASGKTPRTPATSLLDSLLPQGSLLRDDVRDPLLPGGSGFDRLPTTRSGPFIPADELQGEGLTRL